MNTIFFLQLSCWRSGGWRLFDFGHGLRQLRCSVLLHPSGFLQARTGLHSDEGSQCQSVVGEKYSVVQKNSCMFEFPAFLPPTYLGQPMDSPTAMTEHVSQNLAGFFSLHAVQVYRAVSLFLIGRHEQGMLGDSHSHSPNPLSQIPSHRPRSA